MAAVVASPPCLISSEGTLSTTGDFPGLRLLPPQTTHCMEISGSAKHRNHDMF
ncbi:hypothetical protein DPMN_116970 [Dreissena polymorpha]|uniref:Uncharacterized protein n=1 Tax=Dreissena polymorpha TaxID=45954 RepID=A0A9D4QUR3_DREPO|nr:hypothetical protein DPMN_116970 [Dreissena polymorpha]